MLMRRKTTMFDYSICLSASLLLALLFWGFGVRGERDFNFNDSQVPLLEPKDEPQHARMDQPQTQDPYAAEVARCHYTDSELILSLVLKSHDWHDLSEPNRNKVLEKLSKFFAIPKEFIVMESVTKRELYEMQKESIRKGNNKCHTQRRLGRVNLMIGCGSSYFTMGEPIANQIAAQMKDGSIDNISGEKFGWWAIWRKHFKTRAQRSRRQVEGSGEDDDYEDAYDYDDDEEDNVETVTEIPAVTTHAHRHHHGVAKPELNEGKLEPRTSEQVVVAVEKSDANSAESSSPDSNLLLLRNTNNKNGGSATIDEEIVESVSQLESVITKTIENTKNLKELPVVDAEETAETGGGIGGVSEDVGVDVPVAVVVEMEKELNANSNTILEEAEEFSNELLDHNNNNNKQQPESSTRSSGAAATSATKPLTHLDFNGVAEDHNDALESGGGASVPLMRNLNADIDLNSLAGVAPEVVESSSLASSTVTIGLDGSAYNTETTASPSSTLLTTITNTPSASSSSSSSSSSSLLFPSQSQPPLSESVDASSSSASASASSAAAAAASSSSTQQHHQHHHLTSSSTLASSSSSSSFLSSSTTATTTPPSSTVIVTTIPTKQHKSSSYEAISSMLPNHLEDDVVESTTFTATTTKTTTNNNNNNYNNNNILNVLTTITTTITQTQFGNHAYENTATLPPPPSPPPPQTNNNNDDDNNAGKKDENEATTLLPDDNQDGNRSAINTTPTHSDDLSGSSPSALTPTSTTSLPPTTTTTTMASPTTPTSTALPETTTPMAASTDYVEPRVENSPPMIKTRLQKFAVTSGKSFTFTVPDETFYDNEDITNLRLELTDRDGHELKPSSWLQFNAETREIYGLPLDDAVSKWQYRLSATDSGNETVTETVEMSVQQHRGVRSVNHEINISVKINEKNMHNIDWQMQLIRAIANTLDDESTGNIVVREIRQTVQEPSSATFVYFNETLPTSECPEAELNKLVKELDASRLSDLVYPTLGIKSITGQLIGACQKTQLTKPKPTTHMSKNLPPMPRNQVDRVAATVGHLLVYKVPSDTFYDPNDNELTLSLKTKEHKELSPRHWLQFDTKNQEFYGIPKGSDTGSEEYLLVAEDAGGLSATDALVVVVNHAPKKEFSVYFKAYLAVRHELFNADLQRKFVERISALFGDNSAANFVQIRSANKDHDSDGTIVNFYNTTLFKQHNRCPEEEIEAARNVYLMQDYLLRDRVKKALGPELNLTNVQVLSLGACNPQTDVTHREFIPKVEEPSLTSTFTEDYMFVFIYPAIIIVVMIIVASIIACCLHRRRHKSGKMELGNDEERKSFRTKGIPVIFQDELDEKPEIGNKSPIILKDEKPPLLPPSYNTSNMNGDNDVDEYVPPPAVVVGGREARGKSPHTPSYRKPPPYVSP